MDNKFSKTDIGRVVLNRPHSIYGYIDSISQSSEIYPINIVTSLDWKGEDEVASTYHNVYYTSCDENGAEDVRLPPNWEKCDTVIKVNKAEEKTKSTPTDNYSKNGKQKEKADEATSLYDSISESIRELELEIEKKRKVLQFILEAEEMGYSIIKK